MRMALRHGEQVMITLFVPPVLLVGLTFLDVIPLPAPRINALVPGILTLAILSTAFTSQAITLGFDRRYGVMRRLAATAIPRWLIVVGRLAAGLGVVAVQCLVLGGTALVLGWRPAVSGLLWAVPLVLLGCAAFASLGVLLGGTLRADVVLAVANVVWFGLLIGGGTVLPTAAMRHAAAVVVELLPSGALADSLHFAFGSGQAPGIGSVAVLVGWTVATVAVAVRTVRLD